MPDESTVSDAMLVELARLARIEIEPERRAAIREQLDGLLSDANEVNRFMEGRRDVGIAVRFHHPPDYRDD